MGQQDVGDVLRSERAAELGGVTGIGPQHRHVAPAETGMQNQGVEPIGFGRAVPHRPEGGAEPLLRLLASAPGHAARARCVDTESEVVDPAPAPIGPDDLEGPLVQHLDTEALQCRKDGRQRGSRPEQEQPEMHLLATRLDGQLQMRLVTQFPDPAQVGERLDGVHVVLVALRHPGQVVDDLVVVGARGVEHPVVPGQDRCRELPLQPALVRGRRCRVDLDGEVDQRETRLPETHGVVDAPPVELAQEHLLHGGPGLRGVPVVREVDEAGEEPAVGLPAQEQAQPPRLGEAEHADRGLVDVLRRCPEQLVARVPGDHVEHPLPRPGLQRDTREPDGRADPSLEDRGVQHVLVQRGSREQPDEPVLADDRAAGVDDCDAEVVGMLRTQHPARRVGPGEDDRRLPAAAVGGLPGDAVGNVVPAQHAQPGPRHRTEPARACGPVDVVAPISEEHEATVPQPLQQPGDVRPLIVGRAGPFGQPGQLGSHPLHRRGDPLAVLRDLTNGDEHLAQFGTEVLVLLGRDRVQIEPHPRLDEGTSRPLLGIDGRQHLDELAVGRAAHHDHHMDDLPDPRTGPSDGGQHGRNQEGHVVADHIDDGGAVRGRSADVDDRLARRPVRGEAPVGAGGVG